MQPCNRAKLLLERDFSCCMQLGPTRYKSPDKPFHGGDTGSTPVRDAKFLRHLQWAGGYYHTACIGANRMGEVYRECVTGWRRSVYRDRCELQAHTAAPLARGCRWSPA